MNWIVRAFFPYMTWKIKCRSKVVYITFDDGPTYDVTPQVLDILDIYNAKATFFCLGKNVEENPELYEEILRRGHSTGVHGYEHLNGWTTSNRKYIDNVHKASHIITSGLFRPPYGKMSLKQIQALSSDFDIIMWSHISYDFDSKYSAEKCLKKVTYGLTRGSIVVFHDNTKAKHNVITTLPMFLEYLQKHDYKTGIL